MTHNLSAIDGSNISSQYSITVETQINNISGVGSFTEDSTYINPSVIILTTTTESTDTEYVSFNMSNYKDGNSNQNILLFKY